MASIRVPLSMSHTSRPTGLAAWLTTTDHKKIGILYLVTTFIFFLFGGLLAELIRWQLLTPHDHCVSSCGIVSPDTYDQLFTMHGSVMIFLWIIPVWVGFANYFVPLMIGARDMAFPRLNALSYWLFLFAGTLMLLSFGSYLYDWVTGWSFIQWVGGLHLVHPFDWLRSFFGGAFAALDHAKGSASAGWTAYPPLSSTQYTPTAGQDYWILGLHIAGISSIIGAINILVTILTLRTKGMLLFRMPLFVWGMVVTSFLTLVTSPVLAGALAMLLMDRQFGTHFFAKGTGDPILWQYLFWFYSHPAVYIMILPGFGIISEILPVFTRKPIFGYKVIAYSTIAIGVLGMMVFGHHMFASTIPIYARGVFMTMSLLIAVPTGVKIFNWIGTLWGGHIQYKTPMLFAYGFLSMFLIGGISGVYLAVVPVDFQLTDSYFVVAHIHYVLFGGSVFTIFAALYYWLPKITGRMLSEPLGVLNFWTMFIGFNLTFLPQHWLGLDGMVRRTYAYPTSTNWGTLNFLSSIGAFILGIGVLVFVLNFLLSLRGGTIAGNDPWEANTLEWATSSPPPAHNFDVLPEVGGLRPVRDMRLGIRRQ